MSHYYKDPEQRFCLVCGKDTSHFTPPPACAPIITREECDLLMTAMPAQLVFQTSWNRRLALEAGHKYSKQELESPIIRAYK